MNWIGWLGIGAGCTVCLIMGWIVRGAADEARERDVLLYGESTDG